MMSVAVLGSGDLAGAVARRLAETERAGRVMLVDADEGRARGKALDIAQSAPTERFDCRLEAARDLVAAGPFDALVVADPAELLGLGGTTAAPGLVQKLRDVSGSGPMVIAGAHPWGLIEGLVEGGLPRARVVGSVPVALASALRRQLAAELEVEPRAVAATVMGRPPHALLAPQGSATVGGVPVDRLSPVAMRRALAAVARLTPGPVALAAAATRTLLALHGPRPSVLPLAVCLEGEYGHRRVALAVPACVGGGRVQQVLEAPLDPVDRVALDNAARARG